MVVQQLNRGLTEIENHLDSPESIFSALENELRLNPAYLGCGVAFEPDYYPSEGRWFEPYVLFKDSTTIERRQIGSAQHDYLNQEWYQAIGHVHTHRVAHRVSDSREFYRGFDWCYRLSHHFYLVLVFLLFLVFLAIGKDLAKRSTRHDDECQQYDTLHIFSCSYLRSSTNSILKIKVE